MSKSKCLKKRTAVFLGFMISFLLTTGWLTYYSGEVYLNTLPKVETVMPEVSGQYENGRMTYLVPAEAIRQKDVNSYYVLTARHVADEPGERYQAAEVAVWVLEEVHDDLVRVDGIIWEEPILIGTDIRIQKWDSIRVD